MTQKSLIRIQEVKKQTGLSRSSIYSLMKTGDFPPCVPISIRAVGWVSTEIDNWIQERINAARNEGAL